MTKVKVRQTKVSSNWAKIKIMSKLLQKKSKLHGISDEKQKMH